MLSSRRRRNLAEAWRTRRGEPDETTESPSSVTRRRRSHRAPLPRWTTALRTACTEPARGTVLAGMAALAALTTAMIALPRCRVHGATVVGASRVPADLVYEQSGIDGRLVFAIDTRAVAGRLETLPDVRSATIGLALPDRVTIEIAETEPVIRWTATAGSFAIDERGAAIPAPADTAGLVSVTDETGLVSRVGDTLPPDIFDAALAFGALFGALTLEPGTGFCAQSAEGWALRLGTDATMSRRQWGVLVGLSDEIGDRRGAVAFVDLRFPNRPYYRLTGEEIAP